MKDGEKRVGRWFEDNRDRKKTAALAVVGVSFLALAAVYLLRPGGRVWHALSAGEKISTCQLKEGQYCIECKDPGMSRRVVSREDWAVGCFSCPYFTEEELFHPGLQSIFYGEVKDIREYALQGDGMRDGKKVNPIPYYCHVLTVVVKRGIAGGLTRGREVNLLCNWKYHFEELVDLALQEEIAEGNHALFLVEGNAVTIRDLERGEEIDVLGQVSGRLGGFLIENKEYGHLDRLGSREETISYYKKHNLFGEDDLLEEEGSEGDDA